MTKICTALLELIASRIIDNEDDDEEDNAIVGVGFDFCSTWLIWRKTFYFHI